MVGTAGPEGFLTTNVARVLLALSSGSRSTVVSIGICLKDLTPTYREIAMAQTATVLRDMDAERLEGEMYIVSRLGKPALRDAKAWAKDVSWISHSIPVHQQLI